MVAFENAGQGHSLRSNNNNNSNSNTANTMAELRARRLATFNRTTPTTPTTPTLTPTNNNNTASATITNDTNNRTNDTTTTTTSDPPYHPPPPPQSRDDNRRRPSIRSILSSFHSLMWDDAMTTPSDQERWFHQGIHTPLLLQSAHPPPSSSSSSSSSSTPTAGNPIIPTTTTLEESHRAWGLTQSHGGPCGVLATIQAEMIRVLKRRRQQAAAAGGAGGGVDVREVMAESMGVILARAVVVPRVGGGGGLDGDGGRVVVLVLPRRMEGGGMPTLTWDMMKMEGEGHDGLESGGALHCVTIGDDDDDDDDDDGSADVMEEDDGDTVRERLIRRLARATSRYLLSSTNDDASAGAHVAARNVLECFYGPGGVLMFTMSLVASRGVERIRSDMDNPNFTYLTAQFGMTGQEMINLLLTGQAVSNVFDNTLTLGGGAASSSGGVNTGENTTPNNENETTNLKCHGIQSKPSIGYLSQLESLRYCEVGGYYKSPGNPIWVVGSTSHFTVLFGDEDCLKESKSDVLLERCRRAFKSVEGGEENGFVGVDSLGLVLEKLDVKLGLEDGGSGVQALAASLEVSGAGIILWDDFWKAASRLLTGASLESVLQGPVHGPVNISQQQNDVIHDVSEIVVDSGNSASPPLALTQFSEGHSMEATQLQQNDVARSASASSSRIESDEELAKRLAAEWGTGNAQGWEGGNDLGKDSTNAESGKSDEELARELQAQWNAGNNDMNSITPVSDHTYEMNPNNDIDMELATINENVGSNNIASSGNGRDNPQKPMATSQRVSDGIHTTDNIQPYNFEQFGESFQLHHYNGLRGGLLTSFRVTRLSSQEAVGASVALSTNAQGASAAISAGRTGSGGGDLEDVVRTKYPSCTFDWGGRSPPFID